MGGGRVIGMKFKLGEHQFLSSTGKGGGLFIGINFSLPKFQFLQRVYGGRL